MEPDRTSNVSAYHSFFTRACFDNTLADKRINRKTTTKAGLKILACIFNKVFETGRKIAAQFKESMRIVFDEHLKRRNYVADPGKVEL